MVASLLLATARAQPQRTQDPPAAPAAPKVTPKFEAVAETKLLMDGLAMPNYEGLGRLLEEKPADAEGWAFARGQALLIAETGNLLLLRPPRNQGRDVWMQRAMDLRAAAATAGRAAGNRDLAASKAALVQLTGACNKCHQTFRVAMRVGPNAKPPAENPPRDPK
jgi:cytochrome c556